MITVLVFLFILLLPIVTFATVAIYRIKTRDRNNPHVKKEPA